VWRTGGVAPKVLLKRCCPEHGEASVCIASDARFYWLAKGRPENTCCGGQACRASDNMSAGTLGRNAAPGVALGLQEKLSTCIALIEIVNSCNLPCPTCYADSHIGVGRKVDAVPLEDLKRRIQGVIDRKGGIEILQLSGGEPTLHPQFFDLLRWLQNHPKVDYVLLNTNGLRIAQDAAFARDLGVAFRYGAFQLYLQFDGVQEQGQKFLRGSDLRATRQRCIEICGEMRLPITLAMTVTSENLPFLWDAIEFGLKYPHVRGISFQPMFTSGRVPVNGQNPKSKTKEHLLAPDRLNTADIILGAVAQSHGRLRFEDFTPLPCGDPNCATIGYLLKMDGQVLSVSDFVDFTKVQDFLHDRVRYRLEDLMKCGCESEPLGDLLKQFELDESHTFRLFIKPFMDALTWDEDRIDRCCTHVIRPDGKLDSFCRYYAGFPEGRPGEPQP
jgi:tetraether lipid synthase